MSILSTLKSTFAPSNSVSAARRQSVFGTTSKPAVASAIIGGAAVVGVAGAAVGLSGLAAKTVIQSAIKPVVSGIVQIAKANPIVTGTILTGAAITSPFIVSSIVSNPKVVTKSASGIANFESNLWKAGKEPSLESFGNVVKENPVISGVIGAAGLAIAGKTIGGVATSLLNTSAIRAQTEQLKEITGNAQPPSLSASTGNQITPSSESTTGISTTGPITPATQILGKSAGTSIAKHKHYKKQVQQQSFRINIINANQSRLTTKRYISGY